MEILPSGVMSRQYSRDAATSTVSIQGSGNHYHACASDDYEDVGFDPSILPPPDPWIDSVTDDPMDVNVSSSAILEVCIKLVVSRSVYYKCSDQSQKNTVHTQWRVSDFHKRPWHLVQVCTGAIHVLNEGKSNPKSSLPKASY